MGQLQTEKVRHLQIYQNHNICFYEVLCCVILILLMWSLVTSHDQCANDICNDETGWESGTYSYSFRDVQGILFASTYNMEYKAAFSFMLNAWGKWPSLCRASCHFSTQLGKQYKPALSHEQLEAFWTRCWNREMKTVAAYSPNDGRWIYIFVWNFTG